MLERGYTREFAEQIYQQIQGFGEYGFPESHAASFALLVYVSSWLKRHEPAAFACALLNSQPLGFYSVSSITQDARRHGVQLLPVDVQVSGVDSSLEGPGKALRLGLGLIKGLKVTSSERIVTARNSGIFTSAEDLAKRAGLDRGDLSALAAADALASLAGHRREALWETLGVDAPMKLDMPAVKATELPLLARPTEGDGIVGDYATLGLTLRRHPLALLRERLKKRRIHTAAEVQESRNGQFISTAGLVTCRQRPATASGVIFVTLEDETGYINLIVWNDLAERQRRELLGSRLLAVKGEVQKEGRVVHVLARRLEDLSPLLGRLSTTSHDFH